ncbi:MAG: thiamine-binding protein [Peptoniphilus sp.]|uniref:thiamine-binding protein n=1 Tax=Peptoniphilus sp. TaxID=1971214 RepID=UPI002A75EABA|nr:thiamine-binding protein [Peptoniphilus sp.]MDY2987828.1 thiamine-binding protein [Peptoniphilus sp.]
MNCAIALQTLPRVESDEEVVRIVDEVIAYIDSTGLEYYVGPFETTIEGDLEQIMEIIKFSQLKAIEAGAPSVSSYIKLVYSPEKHILTTDEKISKYHK